MDKPSISTLLDAIRGYQAQFLAFVLNGNGQLAEPKFSLSEPPSFYCTEIVRQMAKTDPRNFAAAVLSFLAMCAKDGCFDEPDRELMAE